MVPQAEIKNKATEWEVPATTVEKDHALGHFLAALAVFYKDQLRFKGGTCLRKCYFPEYRFSDDLDFSPVDIGFVLQPEHLASICRSAEEHSGILFRQEVIQPLMHQDIRKGDQVRIKYWGANHSRHEAPPPLERWQTRIKLEISTEEILILPPERRYTLHPYSDEVIVHELIPCYHLDEVIAEKLRSLVQRSYSAPRDYYDLYHLTDRFTPDDWSRIKPLFLKKMAHKNLEYTGPEDLVSDSSIEKVQRAWQKSISHQVKSNLGISPLQMVHEVRSRILQHL